MDKKTAKIYLPMVKALSEGKTIQYREDDEWSGILQPTFSYINVERYRIKPEPMEVYVVTNKTKTDMLSGTYETEKEAINYINDSGFENYKTVVLLREVTK